MQSPPPPPPSSGLPPPPPSSGLPPPPPSSGQPPMMPPGYGGGMAPAAGNLASPGLRILGGFIDVVILFIVNVIISRVALQGNVPGLASLINLVVDLGYFGYLWSSQGASIGMMPFGFKVRDVATGQYPTMGKAILRGFIWIVEVGFTVCLIGAVGWLWQLWDPQRQAIHDKVVGTIVTTS